MSTAGDDGLRQGDRVGNGVQWSRSAESPGPAAGHDTAALARDTRASCLSAAGGAGPSARTDDVPARYESCAESTDALAARSGVARRQLWPGGAVEKLTDHRRELGDRNPGLLHRVPLANGHPAVPGLAALAVSDGLHVDGHAIRRPDLVLASVEPPDGRRVVVHHAPVLRELTADRVGGPDDVVALLQQREDGHLDRRQLGMEFEHDALLAPHL